MIAVVRAARWLALGWAIALATPCDSALAAPARPRQPPPIAATAGGSAAEVAWPRGYVKVSAVGLPPFGVPAGPASRASARANGVGLAQKRLLATLLALDVRGQTLRARLADHPALRKRLRQLVLAAGVSGETYQDSAVEITLSLPTEGPGGLKAFCAMLETRSGRAR